MSALVRLIRRAAALFVLRALERQYHDQLNLMAEIRHVDTYRAAQRELVATGRELHDARSHYHRLSGTKSCWQR